MLLGKKTIHKNKIAHIIFHKQYAYLIGAINYFFAIVPFYSHH